MTGSGSRPRGDAIQKLDEQVKRAAELAPKSAEIGPRFKLALLA